MMNIQKNHYKSNGKNFKWKNVFRGSEKAEIKVFQVENENFKIILRQMVGVSGAFFSTLSAGMTSGFSAVLLPQLMKNDSAVRITEHQASWIASIAVLPMALGCLVSGIMMEKFGRCQTQRIADALFTIGWVVIGISNSYESICFGRILTGLCTGLFSPLTLVYIAEISQPNIRGVMLASIPLAISTGILISHILGTLFYWKFAALMCGLFPLTGLIIMLFARESPSWLIFKGQIREGEETFRKLRGFSEESSNELKFMLEKQNSGSEEEKFEKPVVKMVFSQIFLKPFLIMLCIFFIQQFSGINAVIFYSVSILYDLNTTMNEYLLTIIIDIVRVIMSAMACILLKKFKRRTLSVFSALTTGISLLGLSFSIKLAKNEFSWIPFPFVIAYVCFVSIGTVPIPWILTGEIFPRHVREIGSGLSSCSAFIMFFVVVKMSPCLFTELGVENAFLIFSLVALFGSAFLYFFLPETKNMTLQNIENNMRKQEQLQISK